MTAESTSAMTSEPQQLDLGDTAATTKAADLAKPNGLGGIQMQRRNTAPDPAIHTLPTGHKHAITHIEKQFALGKEQLRQIVDQFVSDIRYGLSKYGEPMAMIPTYVTGVPNGSETG